MSVKFCKEITYILGNDIEYFLSRYNLGPYGPSVGKLVRYTDKLTNVIPFEMARNIGTIPTY